MPLLSSFSSGSVRSFGLSAFRAVASAATDAYFNLVTLLLNTSSTNGAQNNTFLDSSTNNFTITRNGNTTQGTFTPFSQTGWSNYSSAVDSSYLNFTTSPGTLFQFAGDFTIESYVFLATAANGNSIWVTNDGSANYFALNLASTNFEIFLNGSGPASTTIAHGLVVGQWSHVAMVRSGSTITLYTNGVLKGTITNSSTLGYASPTLNRNGGGGAGVSWYLSNLRIVKSAVYTSGFTPSTTPLTNIANTSLLTCQSNRFVDNSSNGLVATVTGTPQVQAFSPFLPTAAYDAAVVGGSMYNGAAPDGLKFLTSTAQFAVGGDFTIEMWFYPTAALSAYNALWGLADSSGSDNPSALLFYNGSYNLFWLNNGAGGNGFDSGVGINIIPFQWNHIVISRSGADIRCWTNGVLRISNWASGTLDANKRILYVATNRGGNDVASGYTAGFRFVNGAAVYSGASNFTPPTTPPTDITNTVALVNHTNAGIFDSAAKNNLQTVGNAQVSTTQAKFGTTSMYFDGSGDYLQVSSSVAPANFNMGTGDYTVEFWMYSGTPGSQQCLFDFRNADVAGQGISINYRTNRTLAVYMQADRIQSSAISANTWTHVAVVRASGTYTLYVDGVSAGTWANSDAVVPPANRPIIGAVNNGTQEYNGYLDDLRVTKGYARYTANFTPPSSAFSLQ